MLIVLYPQISHQPTTSFKMGLGDDLKDFENDATGQGGNDGDNNANKANGSNDKTEDTMVDSGSYPSFSTQHGHISQESQLNNDTGGYFANVSLHSSRSIRLQGGYASWPRPRSQQLGQRRSQQVLDELLIGRYIEMEVEALA